MNDLLSDKRIDKRKASEIDNELETMMNKNLRMLPRIRIRHILRGNLSHLNAIKCKK